MVGNVRAAKAVIFSKLNQRRRLAQRRRILATTTQRKKVGSQLEIKATKKVIAGVSKSRYISISIPIKYSNFSRFYKKLGPFYKKLRCDKFGN